MSSNTLQQLKRAKEIVDRYLACGSVFPRELRNCGRSDPTRQQEYRDACKIKTWKYSLLGKNRYSCSDEVRDYMDENMPGWRDRVYSHKGRSSTAQMTKAREIVQRYRERGCVRPRRLNDPSRKQEYKDAVNLSTWKSALKGHNRVTCSAELCDYLDQQMPGWREDYNSRGTLTMHPRKQHQHANTDTDTGGDGDGDGGGGPPPARPRRDILLAGVPRPPATTQELMPVAAAIVQRYQQRGCVLPSLKAECRQDPSRAQECKDAGILHSWKIHTSEKLTPAVLSFLDARMPGWKKQRAQVKTKRVPMDTGGGAGEAGGKVQLLKAREVVQRCLLRREQGQGWLPRHLPGRQETPQLILEQKDALKLSHWKRAAMMMVPVPVREDEQDAQSTSLVASLALEVRACLDKDLPGWMDIDCESPASFPPSSSSSLLLMLPSSSSSYNNKAAGDSSSGSKGSVRHSLGHNAVPMPISMSMALPSSSSSSFGGAAWPPPTSLAPPPQQQEWEQQQWEQQEEEVLAARKRGTHVRDEPKPSVTVTWGEGGGPPAAYDGSFSPPSPHSSSSSISPGAGGYYYCNSTYSSTYNSTYNSEIADSTIDSVSMSVAMSVQQQQQQQGRAAAGAGGRAGLKRPRALEEEREDEEDWWGGLTATESVHAPVSVAGAANAKRVCPASELNMTNNTNVEDTADSICASYTCAISSN